ncbi:orotidine-5'-phosphate decarboxylase [Kocuria marina subsp. indica]|nr:MULTISPECIES: orotidine-5'-phosphate decarboxylase [Kocuria]MDT0120208.1 orotidine-5'-phosphate decarboxylase [Kocuria sp. PD6]QBJ21567.1 orotidine-5'-phosphate decarboxylase [Kocuria indica]
MAEFARVPFGARLERAMTVAGPLCVGIDPHPSLLDAWGLPATANGLERFALGVLEAAAERCAAVKPQVALFEAYGSAGFAVLERVLRESRAAGLLSIADAKRGDIGSTMAAYASAWLSDDSPLAADAVTLSPYLGFESLRPALDLARETGRGTFVLALTSNPEGASVQHVGGTGSVAGSVLAAIARENATAQPRPGTASSSPDGSTAPSDGVIAAAVRGVTGANTGAGNNRDEIVTSPSVATLGSCGAVIGATVGEALASLDIDLSTLNGPILAPGYGAQGADAAAVATVFEHVRPTVLANSSRGVLRHGPDVPALRDAIDRSTEELRTHLQLS